MRAATGLVLYFLILGVAKISSLPVSSSTESAELDASPETDLSLSYDDGDSSDNGDNVDYGSLVSFTGSPQDEEEFSEDNETDIESGDEVDYNDGDGDDELVESVDDVEGLNQDSIDDDYVGELGPVDFFEGDEEIEDASESDDDNDKEDKNGVDFDTSDDSRADEFDPVPLPPSKPFRLPVGKPAKKVSSAKPKTTKKKATTKKTTRKVTTAKPKAKAGKKNVTG